MRDRRFHLGWFLQGSSVQAWGEAWSGNIGNEWMVPDFFVDIAKLLEKASFDYVLLEDSSYVGESFGGSRDIYLRHGLSVPRQDPSVVATLMIQATKKIGIVPTFATFAYPPYLLARLVGTMDQVSQGRAGWNMVTGSSDYAARNFGMDGLPQHDLRYDMADEYMGVVNGLWASWEQGALQADAVSGILVDPDKVHSIDFVGQYYRSRGPLNSGPCVQERPVIAQAGGSPRGRQFASRHADTIIASASGIEAMKAYREDVRRRASEQGRDPDKIKVLFLVSPIIGETEADAERAKSRRMERNAAQVEQRLAVLGKITNIDFGQMDLDAPVSSLELHTNGHQQSLDEFKRKAGNKSLRQAMDADAGDKSIDLVGTPEQVADRMGEVMDAVGGDGFLITQPNTSRRMLADITDGLVPALQRRGLVRTAWDYDQFRQNLLAF